MEEDVVPIGFASWYVARGAIILSVPFLDLDDCRTKVVMSALSKVKVSSFAGVDLGGGVSVFEL